MGGVVDPTARLYVLARGRHEGDRAPDLQTASPRRKASPLVEAACTPKCPPPFQPRPARTAAGHRSEDDQACGLALDRHRWRRSEYYGLVPFNVAQAKALQALHTMGVVLNSLPVPRNSREWAQAQAAAITLADTMKINRSVYRWPRVRRCPHPHLRRACAARWWQQRRKRRRRPQWRSHKRLVCITTSVGSLPCAETMCHGHDVHRSSSSLLLSEATCITR